MMPDFIAAPSLSEDHKCLSCPSKIEPAARGYIDPPLSSVALIWKAPARRLGERQRKALCSTALRPNARVPPRPGVFARGVRAGEPTVEVEAEVITIAF